MPEAPPTRHGAKSIVGTDGFHHMKMDSSSGFFFSGLYLFGMYSSFRYIKLEKKLKVMINFEFFNVQKKLVIFIRY